MLHAKISLTDMPEVMHSMMTAMANLLREGSEGEPQFLRDWAERMACEFEAGAARVKEEGGGG